MVDGAAAAGDSGASRLFPPEESRCAHRTTEEAACRPGEARRLGGAGWLVRESGKGRRAMGTRSRGLGVKAPQLALLLGCCVASSSAFMLRPPLPLSAATTRGAALGMRSFQLRHPQHLRNARLPVAGCGQGRCRAHHQTTRMQRGEGQGEGAGMLHKFSELLTVLRQIVSSPPRARNPNRNTPASPSDFQEGGCPRKRLPKAASSASILLKQMR